MRALTTFTLLGTLALPLQAQMPWTSNLPSQGLALDFLRPKFGAGPTALTSGALFLSGRFAMGTNSAFKFELPYARAAQSGFSSSTIGDPYIGAEFGTARNTSFEFGVRVPLTSESEVAQFMGFFSDVLRTEAFFPNVLSAVARVRFHRDYPTGLTLDLGGGPSAWIHTKGGGDPVLVLHQHISGGYRGPKAWISFGFGGRLRLTGQGSFAERTIYQIGASAGLTQGQVRPALHLILPLDSRARSFVDVVLGLGVAVALP